MKNISENNIKQIVSHFEIEGCITNIVPWGNGLINDTYRIYTDSGNDYLMQRMNENNYPDIPGIMNNIYMVTEEINRPVFHLENGRAKQKLYVISAKDGAHFYRHEDGSCWRIYNFMQNAFSIEKAENTDEVYASGLILGQFHYLLRDFPVSEMTVVVPDFHNPAKHYENLLKAVREDKLGRAHEIGDELEFFKSKASLYDYFNILYNEGRIDYRVNHNDPKINNIMFDNETREPMCMVDLDTMMPGFIPYDFGDAVRSCMCTGKDSIDMDMEKVSCNMDFYNAYLRGFLDGTQGILTKEEEEGLAMGAKLIALESGMRYLTDYLNGDVYLKVRYPKQNLIKSRMHIQLAKDMLNKM